MIVCHLTHGSVYEAGKNVWPEEKFREQQEQQSFICTRFSLNQWVCWWGPVHMKSTNRELDKKKDKRSVDS